jgi:hypothetical protein
MILGAVILAVLALIALCFTALLLVSGWNGVRDELVRGFRIDPPGLRGLGLAAIGMLLPVASIAILTGYLAVWLIGLILGRR